jgi:hypothetical protein
LTSGGVHVIDRAFSVNVSGSDEGSVRCGDNGTFFVRRRCHFSAEFLGGGDQGFRRAEGARHGSARHGSSGKALQQR